MYYIKAREFASADAMEAVVLISEDDLKLLEAYENLLDARAAEQALAEMEARGEKPIPWEIVKKEAGL
jgi:cytochrome c553